MPASERAEQHEPADERAQGQVEQALERARAKAEGALERANAQIGQALERAEQAIERAEEKVVIADPRAIRALAHPARIEAIDQLYSGEVLTATELANAVDVSPSAMSYHLRELAKWGVIERVDDGSDGRERRWRAAGTDLQIGTSGKAASSTASRVAHMALTRQMIDRIQKSIDQHMSRGEEEPEEWRAALEMGTYDVILTKEEMRQLGDQMRAVIEQYSASKRRDSAPEGSHKVRVMTIVVPTTGP